MLLIVLDGCSSSSVSLIFNNTFDFFLGITSKSPSSWTSLAPESFFEFPVTLFITTDADNEVGLVGVDISLAAADTNLYFEGVPRVDLRGLLTSMLASIGSVNKHSKRLL